MLRKAQSARQAKVFAKYPPPLEFTATEKVNSKKSFARSNEIMHAAYSCFSNKNPPVELVVFNLRVKPSVISIAKSLTRSPPFAFANLLLLEWVYQLRYRHLFYLFIFFQLVSDILLYLRCILPNCVYIISSTPKLSVAVLEFHIRPFLIN